MKRETDPSVLTHRPRPAAQVADNFYNGFCNNVLWPLLHYIPLSMLDSQVSTQRRDEKRRSYRRLRPRGSCALSRSLPRLLRRRSLRPTLTPLPALAGQRRCARCPGQGAA